MRRDLTFQRVKFNCLFCKCDHRASTFPQAHEIARLFFLALYIFRTTGSENEK